MACDAATLLAVAITNGYDKLSSRDLKEVILAAACAGGGGSSSTQDMQVAWTPTNLKLGEVFNFTLEGNPTATSITLQGTSIGGIEVKNNSALVSISAAALTAVDPSNVVGEKGLLIIANSALTTVSLPVLSTVGSGEDLKVNSNPLLTALSLPLFTVVPGVFEAKSNALTSFSAPHWIPQDFSDSDFSGNALPAAQVNNILHIHVLSATWGTNGETLLLNGGTNSAPSGAGIADKATLIGRGATVTTN